MNFILDQIVKWALVKASGLIGVVNELITTTSIGLLENEMIKGFISACSLCMNWVLGIAVVMWFFKTLKLHEAGSGQIFEHIQALVATVIFSRVVIPGVEWIYTVGMNTATLIGKVNLSADLFTEDKLGNLFKTFSTQSGGGTLFSLIMIVLLLIESFKILKQQLKRFPVLLGHIPLAVLYLPSIGSGNLENMWSWGKSCGGVMISHIIQITFLIIGFYLLGTSSVGNFIIGLGFVLTASKLDQLYGQWATSTQPSGYGRGIGQVAHSLLLFRR